MRQRVPAVAAGVLGKKRKLMSLCGDTMNVASRCESTAPPGHIQATRHFWEGLSSPVRELFVQREVAVKGKGLMDMFVLDVSTQEDALSDLGFNLVRDPERWQLVLDA